MKRILYFACLFMGLLNAMERVDQRMSQETILRIENRSHDKILIRLRTAGELGYYHRTLVPGEHLDLFNLGALNALYIKAYGKYKEWISAETFFRGLPNLIVMAQKKIKELNTLSLKLAVLPGWDPSQAKGLYHAAALVCQNLLPYEYGWQEYERVDLAEYHELTDVFLQVKYALAQKISLNHVTF